MMVTDLRHLLDLPPDAPGPVQRLASYLGGIVTAATAGDVGVAWETALPCRRRPGHRPCPGHVVVVRTGLDEPIRWQCSGCGDAGLISDWTDSPFDLRRRHLILAATTHAFVVTDQVAATLRDLPLLDADSQRLVFQARAHPGGAALDATVDDLDELIGSVAAEANHESQPARRRRLDAALDALTAAAATSGG